ncbi:MAG: xanthine phosphoribosyltransferase [Lachnospiraceae bacterium]|nr:xanthine phosphoribosyltransferase [Lachnospiraceae bacterium]
MKELEERILMDGVVKAGDILKVDNFLNHQLDPQLFYRMGLEWKRLYEGEKITKILTAATSGIAIAAVAALAFDVPVVFARKARSSNLSDDVFTVSVHSYTHGDESTLMVSKQYLGPEDSVLILDDFLANGAALTGLVELAKQAGCRIVGAGAAIEKAYQPGGERIRSMGIRVESLAKIVSMDEEHGIVFAD